MSVAPGEPADVGIGTHFCGTPESALAEARQQTCQWPRGYVIKYAIVKVPSGFTLEQYRVVVVACWKAWEDICGIRTEFVTDAKRANCVFSVRRLGDGPGGALAEAYLPCGNVGPTTQLMLYADEDTQFSDAVNPPRGRIPLRPVMIHEIGHLLGISHNNDGATNAIMDPAISHIRTLQQWDIKEAIFRYGERTTTTPDPDDDTPAPGDDEWAGFYSRAAALLLELVQLLRKKAQKSTWPE